MPRLTLPGVLVLLLALLAPPGASAQDDTTNFLRAGDEVLLRVWPDTTLSGRYRVEADGMAYFPIAGAVSVVDRPVEDVRGELLTAYAELMRNPVVVVVPLFRVSVLGAVRGPGLYYVEPPTTLIEVVSQAGGFTPEADLAGVRLLRGERVYSVNAEAALELGSSDAAVALESGDRIVVPEGSGMDTLRVLQFLVSLATLTASIIRIS